jgi:uncharacterized circularly permuted ATP-grasp superfamily protein/uncharacterized alpha-E superfamily protein
MERRISTATVADAADSTVPTSAWGYRPTAFGFDEAFETDGSPRAAFAELFESLSALGEDEFSRRWTQAQRVIRDNGITYNVYGDPRGTDRPWQLDPLPLILGAPEWALLERGLEQRGRLLDAVLTDLYGPGRLLADGVIPPELVLENPGFLRPLHNVPVVLGARLHLYAADVARGSDGRFWVLGDRTQAPSGAGYALENRIVVSRMLPQVFRHCRVERLAPFFRTVRDGLSRLSPRNVDTPRIVLLTPGPYNETYFEHAYLARYLGYNLVEGGDLTVRDRAVHLKTLGGLQRVDVILRRLDDTYADPLSLRSDSSLGIAGLVHAVRAGNVTVANALGSGLLEVPALLGFLPAACRALLGEAQILPSVPTFWCGEPEACRQVLSRLPELVIKPAIPAAQAEEPVFAGELSRTELAELEQRIRARPGLYVAQERLGLSTAPAWNGEGLSPRHLSLRAFLARRDDGGFEVMPGGLTRVANSKDSLVVSMQRGGNSKDTWVLSSGDPLELSLLRAPGQKVDIVRSGGDLPSRVADNLFWIGRYIERAETTTRLLRSLLARRVDDAEGRAPEVGALLVALEDALELVRGTLTRTGGGLDAELARILVSAHPSRTPSASVAAAYRAAGVVRDRLSVDTWRVLSELYRLVDQARSRSDLALADALEIAASLLLGFSAFSGLSTENMTHGPGWRFADIGRRIERGSFMVRLLKSTLVSSDDPAVLDAVLETADSAITYRSRYPGIVAHEAVLDLLLTDETNPRSLVYQLSALEEHVKRLPRAGRTPLLAPETKTVVRALSVLRLAELERWARADAHSRRTNLDDALSEIETALPLLADQLTLSYLAHAEESFTLGGPEARS